MSDKKVNAGEVLNKLLEGGLESDVVTTIYGPAGAGKSCVSLVIAKKIVESGKKVIFIDTEGGFSVERFTQLGGGENLDDLIVLKVMSFADQVKTFEKLSDLVNDRIGIVIIDSIAMLYRFEIGKSLNVSDVNKSLGMQLSSLIEIARKKNIPVVITSHVYADFNNPENIKLVGGDTLKYSSKCLIELKKMSGNLRTAIIRKHRSIAENKEIKFKIKNEGIDPILP